ncbi:hypothetical protein H2200_011367 [Cladophialophora chaetospira]|uniref:F-box domain-containing protein n=1 Tax=Cladophialophora chaetospira TaxID=386627 RepID=A0AA39CD32_9EURO|nr:hypothetical protein H2200_011367 [Cladophialophora chaetospira]
MDRPQETCSQGSFDSPDPFDKTDNIPDVCCTFTVDELSLETPGDPSESVSEALAEPSTTRRTINDFPTEVLELVLAEVIRAPGNILNALTTCTLWRRVGENLLWTDVALTDETLPRFCASDSAAFATVHTLTVRISLPDPRLWEERPTIEAYHSTIARTSEVRELLWSSLVWLPAAIMRMNQLESFSFTVDPDPFPDFDVPTYQIRNMLDALPPTLRQLELNTSSYWDRENTPEDHFCPSIGRLLPQLKNLRLQVGRLCEDVFQCSPSGSSDKKDELSKLAQTHSRRGSLTITTISGRHDHIGHWSSTLHCKSLPYYDLP